MWKTITHIDKVLKELESEFRQLTQMPIRVTGYSVAVGTRTQVTAKVDRAIIDKASAILLAHGNVYEVSARADTLTVTLFP